MELNLNKLKFEIQSINKKYDIILEKLSTIEMLLNNIEIKKGCDHIWMSDYSGTALKRQCVKCGEINYNFIKYNTTVIN